ncbi:MAG: hypothetical protein M1819_004668 [Sarea resinae]|nr:MAG: hypothetical protein M1819_004668 [Sarea resinae]
MSEESRNAQHDWGVDSSATMSQASGHDSYRGDSPLGRETLGTQYCGMDNFVPSPPPQPTNFAVSDMNLELLEQGLLDPTVGLLDHDPNQSQGQASKDLFLTGPISPEETHPILPHDMSMDGNSIDLQCDNPGLSSSRSSPPDFFDPVAYPLNSSAPFPTIDYGNDISIESSVDGNARKEVTITVLCARERIGPLLQEVMGAINTATTQRHDASVRFSVK